MVYASGFGVVLCWTDWVAFVASWVATLLDLFLHFVARFFEVLKFLLSIL